MRKIKFRCWNEEEKMMIDGDSLAFEQYAPISQLLSQKGIMQFTGLKDINGLEIYEGDIFKHRYVVTYVDGSKGADLGMNVGFYDQRDDFESWAQLEVGQEYEVIGNIYENIELLSSETK